MNLFLPSVSGTENRIAFISSLPKVVGQHQGVPPSCFSCSLLVLGLSTKKLFLGCMVLVNYVGVGYACVFRYPPEAKVIRYTGAGVAGCIKPPDTGSGNCTQVL